MAMFSVPSSLVRGGGEIVGVAIRSARIYSVVLLLSFPLIGSSLAAATQASPPPEKVDTLIELLSDPPIKTWLKEQVTSDRQKQAAASVDATQHPMLSNSSPPFASMKSPFYQPSRSYLGKSNGQGPSCRMN